MSANAFLRTELFEHLAALTPETQPQWGAMTAQHMVEHLMIVTGVATGFMDVPVTGTEEQIAKRRWHTFENRTPFPRSIRLDALPATPGPLHFGSLPEAIDELRAALDRFFAAFAENPALTPNHPLLGALDFAHWEDFLRIHAEHHLRQFGLIPDIEA